MSNDSHQPDGDDMQAEYDFSDAVQGKYAKRFVEGTNLVLLAPDVAKAFPDAESVNAALRKLMQPPPSSDRQSA